MHHQYQDVVHVPFACGQWLSTGEPREHHTEHHVLFLAALAGHHSWFKALVFPRQGWGWEQQGWLGTLHA